MEVMSYEEDDMDMNCCTKRKLRDFFLFITHYSSLITALAFLVIPIVGICEDKVNVGIEVLLEKKISLLKDKRIGLITNHTAVNNRMESTINLMKSHAEKGRYKLVALFAPEHGITGAAFASEEIKNEKDEDGIPIYSLHGETRRPTKEMLKDINLLIYDIQDIGSRSYTYLSTLFYAMEEAAKYKIPIIVADRPNPINGITVDGPMLEEKWRSAVGYVNVPYCYGMTIGELAKFFNEEYKVGCKLTVIPMKGWKREMSFADTHLPWVPTSPHVPEPSTAFYYPMTGLLGELQIVNIGIGYTMPFKVIGAPWMNANQLAEALNAQKLPGVFFHPFYFKPFYGRFAKEFCEGVYIVVSDPLTYKPVTTQFVIIGLLKSLYPNKFQLGLENSLNRKEMFCKVSGTDALYNIIKEKKYLAWETREFHRKEREAFGIKRKKYLLPNYQGL